LFVALSCQFPAPFLGVNKNIVRVAQFLLPRNPRLAEPMHVAQFDLVHDGHHFLVDFGLQFLDIGLVKPGIFRP
jgi:hypothetical protein